MAAPNIKNPNIITGITTNVGIGTTAVVGILTNLASSNQVFKINSIYAANVSGSATDISISIIRNGTERFIARTLTVPSNATQILCNKDTYFYLEENVGIQGRASAANAVDITIGYEAFS